jgi:hypothetical protein
MRKVGAIAGVVFFCLMGLIYYNQRVIQQTLIGSLIEANKEKSLIISELKKKVDALAGEVYKAKEDEQIFENEREAPPDGLIQDLVISALALKEVVLKKIEEYEKSGKWGIDYNKKKLEPGDFISFNGENLGYDEFPFDRNGYFPNYFFWKLPKGIILAEKGEEIRIMVPQGIILAQIIEEFPQQRFVWLRWRLEGKEV